MVNQKKVKKGIESLNKQIKIHAEKIKDYSGENGFLIDYWKGELNNFKKEILKKEGKLSKKRKI